VICTAQGIGLWGAGHSHWRQLLDTQSEPDELLATGPKPEVIPPRERRRAPMAVRMAVEVATQAFESSSLQPENTACVFASGMGDTSITDHMCRAVCTADKLLSPTKFHNSVHNAAAGYWTISTDCAQPANSVSAFQFTTALALLESAVQCTVQEQSVLLVVFDIATPTPLAQSVEIETPFAAAMLLSSDIQLSGLKLQFETIAAPITTSDFGDDDLVERDDSFEDGNNPAAKLLPLLQRIANTDTAPVIYRTGKAAGLSVKVMAEGTEAS